MLDWQPLILSLEVAGIATVLVFIAGTLLARFFLRHRFPGKDILEAFFLLPLVLPPVVTGYALLLLLGRYGPLGATLERWFNIQIIFTPYAAVIASLIVAFPLMYQSAKAAFQGVERHLEDAARSLGTGEWRIFLTITIPLAWPGLLAGLLLSFARALGEFGATIMVAGNIEGKTTTAPVAIYSAVEGGDFALAGRYVVLLSVANFALVLFLNVWTRRHAVTRQSLDNAAKG